MNVLVNKIDGLLFDKDGTLFDFHATWSSWALSLIDLLSEGDDKLRTALAASMDFDLELGQFRPTSPIIAGTNREAAECVARALPGRDVEELEELLTQQAAEAPLSPPVPLVPLLDGFLAQGLALGVMTNDSEYAAVAQLRAAGIYTHFQFVAGSDSGYGAKPDPDPLWAFSNRAGLDPGRVAMVGDSTHDLIAGRAAGMQTIAVLTGAALDDELRPYADVVLPNIGHIPGWLAE